MSRARSRARWSTAHGVKIVGHRNVPSRLAADASALFARNLYNFLSTFWDKEAGEPVLRRRDRRRGPADAGRQGRQRDGCWDECGGLVVSAMLAAALQREAAPARGRPGARHAAALPRRSAAAQLARAIAALRGGRFTLLQRSGQSLWSRAMSGLKPHDTAIALARQARFRPAASCGAPRRHRSGSTEVCALRERCP